MNHPRTADSPLLSSAFRHQSFLLPTSSFPLPHGLQPTVPPTDTGHLPSVLRHLSSVIRLPSPVLSTSLLPTSYFPLRASHFKLPPSPPNFFPIPTSYPK